MRNNIKKQVAGAISNLKSGKPFIYDKQGKKNVIAFSEGIFYESLSGYQPAEVAQNYVENLIYLIFIKNEKSKK